MYYIPTSEESLMAFITPFVVDIRNKLAKKYLVNAPSSWYKYRGLCDLSVNMLHDELMKYNEEHNTNFIVKEIHGEQAHTFSCPSWEWDINQHTWCTVSNSVATIYVDPTSSQFQILYDDIPDYYISPYPPRWYLADKDNLMFKYDNKLWRQIIYFFQFHIWGNISDIIHKMVRRR